MAWALTLLFVAFSSLLALSIPDSDYWQTRFLHLVLMLIVLANVGVNVLQVKNKIQSFENPDNKSPFSGRHVRNFGEISSIVCRSSDDGSGHGR